jgi:hypothetical protein
MISELTPVEEELLRSKQAARSSTRFKPLKEALLALPAENTIGLTFMRAQGTKRNLVALLQNLHCPVFQWEIADGEGTLQNAQVSRGEAHRVLLC